MSTWETLSYRNSDGTTGSITRFTSGDKPSTDEVLIGSKGTQFADRTCWLSHDVVDAYMLSGNDTSDAGYITAIFGDDSWNVYRHRGSLWTATIQHGPSYEWHDDVLSIIPDWVQVGGNWDQMDK